MNLAHCMNISTTCSVIPLKMRNMGLKTLLPLLLPLWQLLPVSLMKSSTLTVPLSIFMLEMICITNMNKNHSISSTIPISSTDIIPSILLSSRDNNNSVIIFFIINNNRSSSSKSYLQTRNTVLLMNLILTLRVATITTDTWKRQRFTIFTKTKTPKPLLCTPIMPLPVWWECRQTRRLNQSQMLADPHRCTPSRQSLVEMID